MHISTGNSFSPYNLGLLSQFSFFGFPKCLKFLGQLLLSRKKLTSTYLAVQKTSFQTHLFRLQIVLCSQNVGPQHYPIPLQIIHKSTRCSCVRNFRQLFRIAIMILIMLTKVFFPLLSVLFTVRINSISTVLLLTHGKKHRYGIRLFNFILKLKPKPKYRK